MAVACPNLLYNCFYFRVNGITIATDIICGFPTETDKDFDETLSLCAKYKFPNLFINQFFPRPGTPAALMPRIATKDVKRRTKALTDLFNSYEPYRHKVGETQQVLVTEISHDRNYYVGHNKFYEQVLLPLHCKYMGKLVSVRIISATKFSMMGEPIEDNIAMPGLSKPLKKGQLSGIKLVEKENRLRASSYALGVVIFAIICRIFWLIL